MIDRDLAELYGVPTKALIQAVKRNIERFPMDFMFQLTWEEVNSLRSQIVTLKNSNKRGVHSKYLPFVFTELGAVMLTSVLNSSIAVKSSILVVRAFIKLREIISTHKDLTRKIDDMEKKYDAQFKVVFEAIRKLLTLPEKPKERIGFYKK